MNRDDDFFRLPRARNPLRRRPDEGRDAEASRPTRAEEPPAGAERIPPIVSADPGADPAPPSSPPTPGDSPKRRTPPARSEQPLNPLRRQPTAPAAAGAATPPPPTRKAEPASRPREVVQTVASAPPAAAGAAEPSQPGARRLWFWPAFGLGVVGLVVAGGMLGYWLFMNLAARLVLSDQPLTIRLPEQKDLVLTTRNKIDVLMKGVITAQVPLQQTLSLPVSGTYDTEIRLDTHVPLETVIVYEGVIPVDTMADIEAKAPVNFQNVKKYKNLHFKAKLPMKLRLPVKLVVPVKQNIPLKYKGPLKVTIDHVIKTPVNTILKTALKVNQDFRIPVTSSLPVSLSLPQHPVKATIVDADLFLNLASLRLERKDGAGGPPPAAAP